MLLHLHRWLFLVLDLVLLLYGFRAFIFKHVDELNKHLVLFYRLVFWFYSSVSKLIFANLILKIHFIVCTSFIVWILLISETLKLGYTVNRNIFSWPMWLAVGATGGYLMSFLTMLFSYCAIHRRQSKMNENYLQPRNQF